jgi:hypothetical protein
MPKYSFEAEFLCDVEADLSVPEMIGDVPEGVRTTFYVEGGRFEGPNLRGTIRPVGADWFLMRPDGVGQLDVRTTLETDDGELIYVYYYGLADFSTESGQGPAQGDQSAEAPRIFTNPIFRTSSEKYSWLNGTFAVGIGAPAENKVSYSIYKLR